MQEVYSKSSQSMKLVKNIKPFFKDARGEMFSLFDNAKAPITSVLLITCKKGAMRANHYHKKDSHYSYMLSGKMEYTEKPVRGRNARKKTVIVKAGDIIYTPSMAIHAMKFLEDSAFLALTAKPRNRSAYEDDTVRITLV